MDYELTFDSPDWADWYPERFGAFATTGFTAFNLVTMLATRSTICHVGEVWQLRSRTNNLVTTKVYAEMQLGANGLVGPRFWKRLEDWQRNGWPLRKVRSVWLPFNSFVAHELWHKAADIQRRKVGYAANQNLAIWGKRRFGWKYIPNDPTHQNCSEHLTLMLHPRIDLTDSEHPTADHVDPGTAWRNLKSTLVPSVSLPTPSQSRHHHKRNLATA